MTKNHFTPAREIVLGNIRETRRFGYGIIAVVAVAFVLALGAASIRVAEYEAYIAASDRV
jgi:hypothetical protein